MHNPLLDVPMLEGLLDEQLYHEYEVEDASHTDKHPIPFIYPSEVGDCMRRVFYAKLGYREPKTPQLLRIFANGKSMHDRYQKWFQEIGLLQKENTELRFEDTRNRIAMRIDGLLTIPNADWRAILELKSANQNDFNYMLKTKRPLQKYLLQVGLYMVVLPEVPVLVLVECKNKQRRKIFPVPYSPKLADEALRRAQFILACVDCRRLPPTEQAFADKCQWCAFNDMCRRDAMEP